MNEILSDNLKNVNVLKIFSLIEKFPHVVSSSNHKVLETLLEEFVKGSEKADETHLKILCQVLRIGHFDKNIVESMARMIIRDLPNEIIDNDLNIQSTILICKALIHVQWKQA